MKSFNNYRSVFLSIVFLMLFALPGHAQFTSEFKILASDGTAYHEFGNSVSISGDYAIVSTYRDSDNGAESGAAYIFQRNGAQWTEVKKITPSDGAAGDRFGYSVSISGDLAIVGAKDDDDNGSISGSAYIFARNQGGTDNWGEFKKLLAGDGDEGDNFGYSVSINGDYAIVGAWPDEANGPPGTGSAYIFFRNQGGSDNWGEVKKLLAGDGATGTSFGWSVSINGDFVIVGATSGSGNVFGSGAAYIFARNQGGSDNWGHVKKVFASDGALSDSFGNSASINGDYAIVGARKDDDYGSSSGSAYIFARNQGGADNWGEVKKVTASAGAANDTFGNSVSINGNYAIAGAPGWVRGGVGAAYIFARDEGGADNWGQLKKLNASDAARNTEFGYSVSYDGGDVLVGAPTDNNNNGTGAGAAYFYTPSPPVADAGAYQTICAGQSVPIGGSPTGSGGNGGPYTYSWTPTTGLDDATAANPNASPAATTTYTVEVSETSTGLSATDDVVVTVNPSPVADAGTDIDIVIGSSTAIGGSPTASGGTAPYTYSWTPTTGLDDATLANPTATPTDTTTYTVVVTDASGCTDTDDITVNVLPLVSITITPITSTTIPASGGSFQFQVQITNNSASVQIVDVWNVITKPGGGMVDVSLGPWLNINLAPGQTNTPDALTQNVPAGAPPGTYGYAFNVGTLPGTILDSDNLPFNKTVGSAQAESEGLTAGDEGPALPAVFALGQNYPNPFNPTTTISFTLPESGKIKLTIYNMMGKRIKTLYHGQATAGRHQVVWNAKNEQGVKVASGVYIYKLEANNFQAMKRLILMK